MADVYDSLMEQVLDIAKGEWKPDVHQHAKLDIISGEVLK